MKMGSAIALCEKTGYQSILAKLMYHGLWSSQMQKEDKIPGQGTTVNPIMKSTIRKLMSLKKK